MEVAVVQLIALQAVIQLTQLVVRSFKAGVIQLELQTIVGQRIVNVLNLAIQSFEFYKDCLGGVLN